jgi:hypothetical protein
MARKLLISRLGAGTITVALCATLPGCNLALGPSNVSCVGNPSSRGMSTVVCPEPDASSDSKADSARDTTDAPAAETAADHP